MANPFGFTTPLSGFVDPRRNQLMGMAAGLAGGGLGGMWQGGMQGSGLDLEAQERQQQQEQLNQTSEWLKANYPQYAGLPPAEGFKAAMAEMSNAQSGAGSVRYGLNPIWGQFEDGTMGYGVTGTDGSFKPVETGGFTPYDPRTLGFERSFGGAAGRVGGEGMAAAPGDIAAGQTALDMINQIRTHPELGWATGMSAQLGGNMMGGTGRFAFQNLVDQAKSGAFLTAVQEMRGLGALSNAEGQSATQAITRMNTALSKDDFLKALADYEAIVLRGMERAQARLQGGGVGPFGAGQPAQQPAQPSGAGGTTSSGLPWSIEP